MLGAIGLVVACLIVAVAADVVVASATRRGIRAASVARWSVLTLFVALIGAIVIAFVLGGSVPTMERLELAWAVATRRLPDPRYRVIVAGPGMTASSITAGAIVVLAFLLSVAAVSWALLWLIARMRRR